MTLTSFGLDEPPSLLEMHALRAGKERMKKIGMNFLGFILKPPFCLES